LAVKGSRLFLRTINLTMDRSKCVLTVSYVCVVCDVDVLLRGRPRNG